MTLWIYVPVQAELGANFDALGKVTMHGWRSVFNYPAQAYEIEVEPLEYLSIAAVRTALAVARVGCSVQFDRAPDVEERPWPRDPWYGHRPTVRSTR